MSDFNSWLSDQSVADYEPKPKVTRSTGPAKPRLQLPDAVTERIQNVTPFALKAPDAKAARALVYKVRQVAKDLGRGMHIDTVMIADTKTEVNQSDIALNGEYGDHDGDILLAFVPQSEPDKRRTGRKSLAEKELEAGF